MHKGILCGVILLMLTGCMTVGPDYERPSIDTPTSYRFEEKEVQDLANTEWWEQFNDPVLNSLVATALQENMDLLIATARVEEFFGRYFATRGNQFPFVAGGGRTLRHCVYIRDMVDAFELAATAEAALGHSRTRLRIAEQHRPLELGAVRGRQLQLGL